ncbi:MAG TPA: class I SAM-dependent methyltransferase [Gemmatales bacterium]|nr:class I SAM-dependent methyltransferase [Gemmatales bacterium]
MNGILSARDKALLHVQAGYDRWAAVYDHDDNPLPALEQPVMQEALWPVEGLHFLDVGCGTGRHTAWLTAAGARVTAIDFSTGMLSKARCKPGLEHVQFIQHDLNQCFPIDGNTFDGIISGLALEHINDHHQLFREMYRVLRPGGKVAVSTLHPAMFLRGSQARFTDPETGNIVQPGSIQHTIGELVMTALRTGFTLNALVEKAPDELFANQYPRAEKYLGWPMLLVMSMHAEK